MRQDAYNPSYTISAPHHLTQTIRKTDNTTQTIEYSFKKATEKEIMMMRLKRIPGVILRYNNSLYFSVLPRDTYFAANSITAVDHVCSFCDRCSAATDKNGGCAKVRERYWKSIVNIYSNMLSSTFSTRQPIKDYSQSNKEEEKKAYIRVFNESKRVEKYPFISYALEGINLKRDFMVVIDCANFKAYPPEAYIDPIEKMKRLQGFNAFARSYFKD